ncbi:prepilin peptidase [Marinomonas hwangdonensis]|uniref:Prepilin leader peptidase/N-methyltransferase n=1 Tax=Marinomonas hwangdonensis TaxID=1053647 RepID=A0A3M8Q4W5_9GAMM|nr:A24 family peptidase [Marinomonas hwangdonensis]RNF51147.1 prepilin peptidase [Marinomonas hwangdonensis]
MLTDFFDYLVYCSIVLCVGSFAAAYTVRWPIKSRYLWEKEAHHILSLPFKQAAPTLITAKRSHCVHCHHPLPWYDLIPIVSFVWLKGKCRSCQHPLSLRYPIIESLHVIFCLPLPWLTDSLYELLLHSCIISALIVAATIDLEHKLIPDECNGLILFASLLLNLSSDHLESSVMGLLIGFSLIYFLRKGYLIVRQSEGIGLGDAKLLAALGAWLGAAHLPLLLLGASVSGILYTVLSNKNRQDYMAFGPFLIFSAMCVFYL